MGARTTCRALQGRLLSFGDAGHRYLPDGLLLVEDGRIAAVGDARDFAPALPPGIPVDRYPDCLILPGLIDTHVHYPQTRVIASYGTQLLEWLQRYTFPEEARLADPGYAETTARFFLGELLRNGTTTAAVYCTVHRESVEAFFAESERLGTRMVAGKVMMDRGAPEAVLDTAEAGYRESADLLRRWHGRGRQRYAVTPRFAITSTEAQLEAAGALLREHPDAHLQTHLCETPAEIATVRGLFPWAEGYAAVYDRYGLLGPRSLFGHCVHLEEAEAARLSETGSVAALCPTSNLFLGSGLFDLASLRDPRRPVRVGLATDIGGGTSYSMLRTAAEAYKVAQLRGSSWPALELFRQVTLGNAEALGLEDRIGRLEPGHEADLVVLDGRATPAMAHRMEAVARDRAGDDLGRALEEELFALITLGDDRAVRATYVAGRRLHPA